MILEQLIKDESSGKLHRYNIRVPLEWISLDIYGPLLRSFNGNKYILVMDYFTKFPEAFPVLL